MGSVIPFRTRHWEPTLTNNLKYVEPETWMKTFAYAEPELCWTKGSLDCFSKISASAECVFFWARRAGEFSEIFVHGQFDSMEDFDQFRRDFMKHTVEETFCAYGCRFPGMEEASEQSC